MNAIVFASSGGRKYHFNKSCPAFESAQLLSDDGCGCDMYCRHRTPVMHALRRMGATKAAMGGKLPCLFCVPAHLREMPEAGDHGHEPVGAVDALDGPRPDRPPVCARCIRRVRKWSSWTVGYDERAGVQWENGWVYLQLKVTWPCASAVVLGLAPRLERAA